jgi:hypothetical protein
MVCQNGYEEEGGNVLGNGHGKRMFHPAANAADPRQDRDMLELFIYALTCGSCLMLLGGDLLRPL